MKEHDHYLQIRVITAVSLNCGDLNVCQICHGGKDVRYCTHKAVAYKIYIYIYICMYVYI